MPIVLRHIQSERSGQLETLPDEGAKLGRDPEQCDVVFSAADGVSGMHAEIAPAEGGGYELVDLRSTNGTTLNGHPCRRSPIDIGDQFKLGARGPVLEVVELPASAPARGQTAGFPAVSKAPSGPPPPPPRSRAAAAPRAAPAPPRAASASASPAPPKYAVPKPGAGGSGGDSKKLLVVVGAAFAALLVLGLAARWLNPAPRYTPPPKPAPQAEAPSPAPPPPLPPVRSAPAEVRQPPPRKPEVPPLEDPKILAELERVAEGARDSTVSMVVWLEKRGDEPAVKRLRGPAFLAPGGGTLFTHEYLTQVPVLPIWKDWVEGPDVEPVRMLFVQGTQIPEDPKTNGLDPSKVAAQVGSSAKDVGRVGRLARFELAAPLSDVSAGPKPAPAKVGDVVALLDFGRRLLPNTRAWVEEVHADHLVVEPPMALPKGKRFRTERWLGAMVVGTSGPVGFVASLGRTENGRVVRQIATVPQVEEASF
jgi:hypothetical protein